MFEPRFPPRACPHCGSLDKRTLLSLNREDLFRSNWSYLQEARQHLPIDGEQSFPIEECLACGFVHAGLLPHPAFLEAVYDKVIDAEAARRQNLSPGNLAAKMAYLSTLLRLLPEKPSHRVLDYGCGFGPVLQLLNGIPGVEAYGYETSGARLQDLRSRDLRATDSLAQLETAGPFAAVVLDNVLEHVASPRATLRFIQSVCEPGAVLFVSVPDLHRETIAGQQPAAAAKQPIAMDINPWEHLNYFDVAHLDELLAEFGFRPRKQASLPYAIDIGLRPLASRTARLKNSVASLPRLISYAAHGDVLPSVSARFYARTEADEI
jgi:SAM-dependent methyltransferase